MDYVSGRSKKFVEWLRIAFGQESGSDDLKIMEEVERCARLVAHYYNLTGDVRPQDMHNLVRAVQALKEAYEKDAGS